MITATLALAGAGTLLAQSCTPQSQLSDADRTDLKQTTLSMASKLQAGDAAALQALAVPPLSTANNSEALASIVSDTAPHLKLATLVVDSLWLFNAEDEAASTANGPVEFYCALTGETDATFTLPFTGPAAYAVGIVHTTGSTAPWQASFILKKTAGGWRLSGLEARPLTAAGHDGLWYWREARTAAKNNETLSAWLYLSLADRLLAPMDSMNSTNREKLQAEIKALHQPEISREHPLELDSGSEKFSILQMTTDDAFGGLDVVVHMAASDVSNPATARQRNIAVMQSLLKAQPGVRTHFHGLWVFADAPGQPPYAIEQSMSQIP